MQVRFEKATNEHIPALIEGLSPFILAEMKAMYPSMSPEQVLETAFGKAAQADAAFINGELICVVGVTTDTMLSTTGRPWLIPTTRVADKRYKFVVLQASKKWVKHLLTQYDALENWGTASHTRATAWLKWLGFTVGEVVEYRGHKYVPYRMERENV